jgi:phage/conjugal plasmid C-4 type zinc finger TraR family protein
MADDIDRANDINEQLREIALGEHFRRLDSVTPTSSPRSQGSCSDCGLPIPSGRLKVMPSCVRCLQCQIEYEMGDHRRSM